MQRQALEGCIGILVKERHYILVSMDGLVLVLFQPKEVRRGRTDAQADIGAERGGRGREQPDTLDSMNNPPVVSRNQ
jgi:hypothetical protein